MKVRFRNVGNTIRVVIRDRTCVVIDLTTWFKLNLIGLLMSKEEDGFVVDGRLEDVPLGELTIHDEGEQNGLDTKGEARDH